MIALPFALAAGVYVSVPVASTAGPAANSAAFVFAVTWNVSVWPASFAGPALMLVAQFAMDCAPAPSSTDGSAPLVKLGASFTAVTVMMNVCAALMSTPPFAVPRS